MKKGARAPQIVYLPVCLQAVGQKELPRGQRLLPSGIPAVRLPHAVRRKIRGCLAGFLTAHSVEYGKQLSRADIGNGAVGLFHSVIVLRQAEDTRAVQIILIFAAYAAGS